MEVQGAGKTVLEQITSNYDELFQAEKKVADFILANLEAAVNSNVSELANSSGVSDATVIRFCKHLGYAGYYQMRLLLSRDIGRRINDESIPDNEGTSVQSIFRHIADTALAAANATEEKVYRDVVDILRQSTMVHLVAVGNTTSLCQELGPRLERMGIRSTYSILAEHYMHHIRLGSSTEAVLAISGSGTSRNVVKALDLAKKRGMKTVAVTAFQYSPVSRIADYLLLSSPGGSSDHSLFRVSRLNEMMVLEALVRMLENTITERDLDLVESEMFLSDTKL